MIWGYHYFRKHPFCPEPWLCDDWYFYIRSLAPWRYRCLEKKASRPKMQVLSQLQEFTQSFLKTGRINKLLLDTHTVLYSKIASIVLENLKWKHRKRDVHIMPGPTTNTGCSSSKHQFSIVFSISNSNCNSDSLSELLHMSSWNDRSFTLLEDHLI